MTETSVAMKTLVVLSPNLERLQTLLDCNAAAGPAYVDDGEGVGVLRGRIERKADRVPDSDCWSDRASCKRFT